MNSRSIKMFKPQTGSLVFLVALLTPFLPYLTRGAPFIGDSWVHLGIARDVLASGRYNLSSYNERWPLVNFLIILLARLTGLPELYAGQAVPLLVGLAAFPLYSLCRKLGLSRFPSMVPALFLSLNPLYSYVTFSGAVMKETASFYLVTLLILLASMSRDDLQTSCIISLILASMGLVLGHHYAALVTFITLWAFSVYALIRWLRSEASNPKGIISAAMIFTPFFLTWNILNYLVLGAYFPVFEAWDGLLLTAVFIITLISLLNNRGIFSSRFPWLAFTAFLVAILGLRWRLYILAQPVEPVTWGEARNYIIAAVFSLAGLSRSLEGEVLKALAASSVTMVLFAFLLGHTAPGFTLLIKSLHYYGLLLALGAGLTAEWLLRWRRLKGFGGLLVIGTLLFMAYASSFGTILALNGLGAYSRGELESALRFPTPSSGVRVYGDTHTSYLFQYAS
ncbi:MAG: hypothetical protein QW639_03625, partial [Candidatus Bathyarchaeia archaeon]